MKIAILTQPLGQNYGGIMQAYALQKTLKDHGHEVVTIDRQHAERPALRKALSFLRYLAFKITRKEQPIRLTTKTKQLVLAENLEFISSKITMSETITSDDEMSDHFGRNKYDAIVVGSDQTWRPKYSPSLFNFYLDFAVRHKFTKIAYASSFGVDDWEYTEEQTQTCRELIKQFDFVSVREQSGVELCRDHLDSPASCVLDPTLLLRPEDYQSLWLDDKSAIGQGEGPVFSYILDSTEYKSQVIRSTANRLNRLIGTCQPNRSFAQSYQGDLDDFVYPSPVEWLKSFSKASFIVTDSFHGCVFSIVFNKPFIAIGNQDRGLARFRSLLGSFGLSDRLVEEGNPYYEEILGKEIDWDAVNSKLEVERKRSNRLLLNNISSAGEASLLARDVIENSGIWNAAR